MINWLIFIVLGVLILASYLDIKYQAVPSVLLTGTIFVVLILRPENLVFGVIAFTFAYLLKELTHNNTSEFGVADIKIFVIIGLLLSSFTSLFILFVVFAIFQFVYIVLWNWRINKTIGSNKIPPEQQQEREIPFIPCLLAVYIVMIFIGGVA